METSIRVKILGFRSTSHERVWNAVFLHYLPETIIDGKHDRVDGADRLGHNAIDRMELKIEKKI